MKADQVNIRSLIRLNQSPDSRTFQVLKRTLKKFQACLGMASGVAKFFCD